MKQNKIIRLVYFSASKLEDNNSDTRLSKEFGLSDPYIIPNGISLDDACKIISYLSEQAAESVSVFNLYPKIIKTVTSQLSKYGFKKIGGHWSGFASNITYDYPSATQTPKIWNSYYNKSNLGTNLFFVDGDFKIFESNKNMQKDYFEWFMPGQNSDDLKRIEEDMQLQKQ